jgi:hypothetical protein
MAGQRLLAGWLLLIGYWYRLVGEEAPRTEWNTAKIQAGSGERSVVRYSVGGIPT